jgi:hypothetical protein
MVNYDALIHDRKYFELDFIQARQAQYNFTQAIKVETFLWDLELYGQLQRSLGNLVVLKGGAAAQLFFAPEQQRTSVDIDVIYLGDEQKLLKSFTSIHQIFGSDDLYFKFDKYIPKNPKTSLPLQTYFVAVPSSVTKEKPINIKIDFHLMDTLTLDVVEIDKASAFVIPLAFKPLCLSPESLLGDKLLTLAQGSVGIPPEREDDIPKQLYDLDNLIRVADPNKFKAVERALEILFDKEQSVRTEKVKLEDALNQMISLLERYSSLDSHDSDPQARTAINNFRGNYEPQPPRDATLWGIVSKRLQFLVRCISESKGNPLSRLKTVDEFEKMIAFGEERFNEDRTRLQQELRKEFIEILRNQGRSDVAKRLKNTRLERLFWEIMTPSNVEEIGKMLQTKAEQKK